MLIVELSQYIKNDIIKFIRHPCAHLVNGLIQEYEFQEITKHILNLYISRGIAQNTQSEFLYWWGYNRLFGNTFQYKALVNKLFPQPSGTCSVYIWRR